MVFLGELVGTRIKKRKSKGRIEEGLDGAREVRGVVILLDSICSC